MQDFPNWLKQLLTIPAVTDILVAGSFCQIDRGHGLEQVHPELPTPDELSAQLRQLAFNHGARIDIASPMLDLAIGRIRLHLVLPHGVSDVPILSLRIHPEQSPQLSHLVQCGMLTEQQAEWLRRMVARRSTMMISGPTGSGKTTLLRALLAGTDERLVVIEQNQELFLPPPAISLRARDANQDGVGGIGLGDLVHQALRMRPDRIVVGEVRRDEFAAFVQSVSNGHPGSMTTLHATGLDQVTNRLITLGLISGFTRELTEELVLDSIDLVVQLERSGNRRRIAGVGKPSLASGKLELEAVRP